jgi:hypothetical protein
MSRSFRNGVKAMKRVILAAAFSLAAGAVFAQTPAPSVPTAPVVAPAPAAPSAIPLTKDGKPRAKEVRAACRAEAKGQGLKGDARKQAVADCVVKQRPDLAARMQCSMDPKAKGLDRDAKRAFIKDCIKGKS